MGHVSHQFHTRPLYLQVADELAGRLIRGEWKPGQTIPNETNLAQELGVSLGTIRKAFEVLVEVHVLERSKGRGTIVPDESRPGFRGRFVNIEDKSGRRVVGEIEIVGAVEIKNAPTAIAGRLSVNERTPVLHFARRRCHGGRVFMEEEVFARVSESDRASDAETLRQRALRGWVGQDLATSFTETVSTVPANPHDASLFGIETATPLLTLDRVIRSYKERSLELRLARCNLGTDLVYRAA